MTNNKLIVPNAELVINQLKEEIAAEFGIELGADTSARDNGRVGGELTRRLIELGKQQLCIENVNNLQTNVNQVNPPLNQLH
jgi:small acid-soluble spore protein A (major alpha-type SASP)